MIIRAKSSYRVINGTTLTPVGDIIKSPLDELPYYYGNDKEEFYVVNLLTREKEMVWDDSEKAWVPIYASKWNNVKVENPLDEVFEKVLEDIRKEHEDNHENRRLLPR